MFLRRCLLAAVCVAAVAGVPTARAQSAGGRLSMTMSGGLLGVGPEIGYRASEQFGVRAGTDLLSVMENIKIDDIRYDGRPKLRSGGAMIDFYPFEGGFRVSAGARVNGNKLRAKASPLTSVGIGNQIFAPAQVSTLSGVARIRDVAPAVTFGYGGTLQSGFVVGVEAGALFQGAPRLRDGSSGESTFQAQLDRDRVELENDFDDYKLYPVVQLSLGYRF